jgi:hypothetical protein
MQKRTSKPIPRRSTKIAEDYAKKVRIEPPKGTRQDKGLDVAAPRSGNVPGQHDHGPAQKPKNKKFPEGGR